MATKKTHSDKEPLINRSADGKFTGDEPTWDSSRQYDRVDIMKAFNWYNYLYNAEDSKNFMVQFLNSMPKRKELAKKLKSHKKMNVSATFGWLARAIYIGYPATFTEKKRLAKAIREIEAYVIGYKEEVIEEQKDQPAKLTIQDYLREKTADTIGELEGRFDDFIMNSESKPAAYALFKERNTPQAQIGKISQWAQKRISEFNEVLEDKELAEGYGNFTKPRLKANIKFFESIVADCESYASAKKAVKKPRKTKTKSADKITSKVKYLKEDSTLKITSVNPSLIINATQVWVFNITTRKVGRYIADSTTGPLSIKGTTITGYDEVLSIAKTLRKPAEKLKELLDAGKIQIKKYMDGINAVESKLTGRLNEDTLIIKVIK
jgi:hypothetical protein